MPEPDETYEPHCPAYSAGIDARMRGEPLSACPYKGAHDSRRWRKGWQECDGYYGTWRPYKWGPCQPRPEIHETCEEVKS